MIWIRVKYLNVYAGLMGKHSDRFSFEHPVPLRDVLKKMISVAPPGFKDFVLNQSGEIKSHVWIYIHRKRVFDFEREVGDGEEVVLSLPLVGG